jgi:hypothetical protein
MKTSNYLLVALMAGLSIHAAEPQRKVVVSLTDRKLALVKDGQVTAVYPIAVGRPSSPTPEGTFQVVTRIPDPTWWGPEGKVVAPGPGNPLGTRWIGLSQKGYGIHGTNAPRSIGKAASHGCIRMRKADVESLFEKVAVGDTVEFRPLALSAALELPEEKIIVIAQNTAKALAKSAAAKAQASAAGKPESLQAKLEARVPAPSQTASSLSSASTILTASTVAPVPASPVQNSKASVKTSSAGQSTSAEIPRQTSSMASFQAEAPVSESRPASYSALPSTQSGGER